VNGTIYMHSGDDYLYAISGRAPAGKGPLLWGRKGYPWVALCETRRGDSISS